MNKQLHKPTEEDYKKAIDEREKLMKGILGGNPKIPYHRTTTEES